MGTDTYRVLFGSASSTECGSSFNSIGDKNESCIRVDLEGCVILFVAQRDSLNCDVIGRARVILVPSNTIILGK
jgi:hypothetical protein